MGTFPSQSKVASKITRDVILTSEIIDNFNMVKILMIKPFFKETCSDCMDQLTVVNIRAIKMVSELQESIIEYSEPAFQKLKDVIWQIKDNFCANFVLKADPSIISYARICDSSYNLTHSLLNSISQTFNNFQITVVPGFDILSNMDRWSRLSLSVEAFSQFFTELHQHFKDTMDIWIADELFYFSVYLGVMAALHLLANCSYLARLESDLAIKRKVRSQVIKLMRAPLVSKNKAISGYLPEMAEPVLNY